MSLSRTSAVLALVVVTGLGLSGCAGASSDSSGSKVSASSAAKGSGDLTRATFVTTITAAQLKARTSHVSMDIGVGGQSIKAEGDVAVGARAADTAMSMKMDIGAAGLGSLDMRLVDQVFYLNLGKVTDDKFAKIDLKDTSNPIGKQYSQLLDQMDPSKQLEQFSAAMKSFEKKGSTQRIDGVDTQPYVITLDTSKIAALAELPGSAAASVPKTIAYTMYIGPDDLPRRITTDAAGSKVTVGYSKWGETVTVKAPSAGAITDKDLSSLMSGAAGA